MTGKGEGSVVRIRAPSKCTTQNTLMERTSAWVAIVSGCLFCFHVYALQEAIPLYTISAPPLYSPIVGYATNGAGFAFSPDTPIAVTALGFNGIDLSSYHYQVTLFDAGGNQLATAQISTGSTLYNQTYYESIAAVNLTVGDTYYLGAVEVGSGFNLWIGNVIDPVDGFGTYSVNSDISYVNAATGFVPSGTVPGTSAGQNYFVGANFQFTTVPEPASNGLFILGAAILDGNGVSPAYCIIFHFHPARSELAT